MNEFVAIAKDSHEERRVPTSWRATFLKIVTAFRQGNFSLMGIDGVRPLSSAEAVRIAGNIGSFASALAPLGELSEVTWQTSICRWMDSYWYVLVDLSMEKGDSDLVLFAKVYEENETYGFDVESVHVP
jgi:hypothetical protein